MDTNTDWKAIVDDDEAIRRALLRPMGAAGFVAQAVDSGAALLDALCERSPPLCGACAT